MPTYSEQIGARIRAARKAAGLSQAELGRRVRLDQAFISRLENGTVEGTPSQLLAIAKAAGTTVTQLMGGAEEEAGGYRNARSATEIRTDYTAPPGLRDLASDANLIQALSIGEADWRALATIELPAPVSKDGYVNLLFAIRAVAGQPKVT